MSRLWPIWGPLEDDGQRQDAESVTPASCARIKTVMVPLTSDEDQRLQKAFHAMEPTWLDREPNQRYVVTGFVVDMSALVTFELLAV